MSEKIAAKGLNSSLVLLTKIKEKKQGLRNSKKTRSLKPISF